MDNDSTNWENGVTPINATNLNKIEQKLIVNTYIVTTTETIAENTDYEIPCNYKVGNNSLEIFYMGEKLIKGTHYIEVGEAGAISNKIQFYDWGQAVPVDITIEFDVRGVYTSET